MTLVLIRADNGKARRFYLSSPFLQPVCLKEEVKEANSKENFMPASKNNYPTVSTMFGITVLSRQRAR